MQFWSAIIEWCVARANLVISTPFAAASCRRISSFSYFKRSHHGMWRDGHGQSTYPRSYDNQNTTFRFSSLRRRASYRSERIVSLSNIVRLFKYSRSSLSPIQSSPKPSSMHRENAPILHARKSRVKAATTIISNYLQSAEGVLQGQTIVEVVTQPKCLITSRG